MNLKPSLFTNILDTLSLFSTNNIKLSAEKNSILRIENVTGLEIGCQILNTQNFAWIKGFEDKEMNMIILPQSKNLFSSQVMQQDDPSLTIVDLKGLIQLDLRQVSQKKKPGAGKELKSEENDNDAQGGLFS